MGCGVFVVQQSSVYCSVSNSYIGGIGLIPLFCYRGESRLDTGMKGRGFVSMSLERSRGRNTGDCLLLLRECSGGVRCI